MKLVVNMIMGSMMGAFAEGLTLAEKSELDPKTLLEVVSLGAIASPMFALKGPSMVAGTFAPAFPLKHQQKDMRLALALADELAQDMPVAAGRMSCTSARRDGADDEDFSAVLKAVKKGGGTVGVAARGVNRRVVESSSSSSSSSAWERPRRRAGGRRGNPRLNKRSDTRRDLKFPNKIITQANSQNVLHGT